LRPEDWTAEVILFLIGLLLGWGLATAYAGRRRRDQARREQNLRWWIRRELGLRK
jgi:hypothetical protein